MQVRKARLTDVEEMHQLVNNYAEKGLMLSRPRSMLYEYIRDFVVVEKDGKILGAGALHIMWEDLAEIRALAVKEEYAKQGIGRMIVEFSLQEAKSLGIPKIFTLTYRPEFFKRLGFVEVAKENMPQKVWRECINCPKFPNCDEVCLEINIKLN
ncbi:MAG: GNAT family N-acetyltransferase [Firmicutes bacterium HGW-Firmicutes-12]|nr:MAG: GNAT family N-acetyltransferase [Firmicutes bacterium HGW-Firmicutes-12]